jgi:hypothetical protein
VIRVAVRRLAIGAALSLLACQRPARPHTIIQETDKSAAVIFLPPAAGQHALDIPAVICYISPVTGSGVWLVVAREGGAGLYCSVQFDISTRQWSVAFAGMQREPHSIAVTAVY